VRRAMLGHGCDAPAPRCWPHHFDLATQTSFHPAHRATTAYIGAGLSPGDGHYDEPYSISRSIPLPNHRRCRRCRRSAIGASRTSPERSRRRPPSARRRDLKRTRTHSSPPRSQRRWRCVGERSCGEEIGVTRRALRRGGWVKSLLPLAGESGAQRRMRGGRVQCNAERASFDELSQRCSGRCSRRGNLEEPTAPGAIRKGRAHRTEPSRFARSRLICRFRRHLLPPAGEGIAPSPIRRPSG
jgi:hypothetical protein